MKIPIRSPNTRYCFIVFIFASTSLTAQPLHPRQIELFKCPYDPILLLFILTFYWAVALVGVRQCRWPQLVCGCKMLNLLFVSTVTGLVYFKPLILTNYTLV